VTVGPEAGRFAGQPYAPSGDARRPEVLSVQAKLTIVKSLPGALPYLVASATPRGAGVWSVHRITVQGSDAVAAYVYIGDLVNPNIVSGTKSGAFDENDTVKPITVPENTAISVVWLTTNVAATAYMRLEYLEI
jgi:hypothetical protein